MARLDADEDFDYPVVVELRRLGHDVRNLTLVSDALLESFPVSRYDASLAEVINEISDYRRLGGDWDAEGALPVSLEAVRLATWLVQMVALCARHEGVLWEPPVVGPNADAGINLEWESADRRVLLILRPEQPPCVELVIEEAGFPPQRQTVSVWDAIDHALASAHTSARTVGCDIMPP